MPERNGSLAWCRECLSQLKIGEGYSIPPGVGGGATRLEIMQNLMLASRRAGKHILIANLPSVDNGVTFIVNYWFD